MALYQRPGRDYLGLGVGVAGLVIAAASQRGSDWALDLLLLTNEDRTAAADTLFISQATVKTHFTGALMTLDLRDRGRAEGDEAPGATASQLCS